MRRALPLLLALALLGTGCFGAPWVVPPARVTLGGGAVQAASTAERPQRGEALVSVRASAEPLQLVAEAMDRPVDVGVGYLYEGGPNGSVSGPFGELGWVLYGSSTDEGLSTSRGWGRLRPIQGAYACSERSACTRLTTRTRVASLRSGNTTGGLQVGLQVALELTGFAEGSFGGGGSDRHGGAVAGGATYGEGGIGLYVDGSRSWLAEDRWWTLTAGLVLRVPASVGGFFVFCPDCVAVAFRG